MGRHYRDSGWKTSKRLSKRLGVKLVRAHIASGHWHGQRMFKPFVRMIRTKLGEV
jgi:hypothetical protein